MQHNDELRAIAQWYNAGHGLGGIIEAHYVSVDTERATRIAQAYDLLPVRGGLLAYQAYRYLALEIEAQYKTLLAHGYSFTFTPDDPYPNSAAMIRDVAEHKHIRVFSGGDPHPFLAQTENEQFRAVHDLFGHAAEGYQFGPRGEENAWIHHSQMFTPLAQAALTTETRGQNSWVNFGPYSDRAVRERPFADQKAALLPEWAWDWREVLGI